MSNNQTNINKIVKIGDNSSLDSEIDQNNYEFESFLIFDYSIRSAQTRDSYFNKLKTLPFSLSFFINTR